MGAISIASSNPFAFHHPNKVILQSRRKLSLLNPCDSWMFHKRQHGINRFVIKAQAATNFPEWRNSTSYLQNIKEKLLENSPKYLKEFPWSEAKDVVLGRLLVLTKESLKWSLIGLFVVSSFSDIFFAFSSNMELLLPLGLFIGVAFADFLREFSQDFFHSNTKVDINKQLLGIGSFFVLIKLISSFFKLQGKVFLLNVGNGGLMQVLWLAWKLKQTNASSADLEVRQNDQIVDGSTENI